MARPSEFNQETVDKICSLLAQGQSLREICDAEDMPAKSTVCLWLQLHAEFSDQYARAREAQAEHWADEILEIADDGSNDWMERKNRDGSTQEVINSEHVTRSRLRVDSRKWLMSKLAPKKYGDRVDLTHAGPDGGPVKIEQIQRVIVDPKHSDSESVSSAPGAEPL